MPVQYKTFRGEINSLSVQIMVIVALFVIVCIETFSSAVNVTEKMSVDIIKVSGCITVCFYSCYGFSSKVYSFIPFSDNVLERKPYVC